MKKLPSFVIIFTIFCFSLNADVWMGITPREGSYGVNLASNRYHASDDKAISADNTEDDYYQGVSLNEVADGHYTDENIIAIGSLNDQTDDLGGKTPKTMNISISCSNGDFCFVSESNPTYKRPFELMLFYTKHEEKFRLFGDNEIIETHGYYKIDSTTKFPIPLSTPGTDADSFYLDSFVHFNLVLVLPGTFNSDGSLNYNGTHPLINADDYTAYVTITLESPVADNHIQMITIPFSGFFNGVSSSQEAKRDDAINVTVNRLPAATNLDIETLSDPDKEEQRVHVADIKMLYFWNDALDEKTGRPLYDPPASDSIRMFFSASNDPFYSNRNGFELVHSSVDIASIHNPYNSIGYRIEANSYTVTAPEDKSNWIYHNTNGDTSIGSPTLRAFTGEDKIIDVTDRTLSNEVVTPGVFIYPEIHRARSSQNDFDRYYSYWESPVYLVMDKRQVDNMFAGRYTSTVYFHVVADEQRKPYTGG